ncbi:hypothetical protein POJ06DRAFT_270291 [Lipomyces tetrasporus]|uniref:Uncharacterized protein n=1 Tax=Lipomyces tetrasporus TaxID=54092 RepID=A0AAD7VQN4_9ASCO|nr:uncharacterized protein POJ06DRAFT_270291 [Lipomyces tetrasporus]KAJ8098318.1 hypothetical protein POJ06DRAFT_270291 [Lipomyces tetrasporus]
MTYFLKALSLRERTRTMIRMQKQSMPQSMQELYVRARERVEAFVRRFLYFMYSGATYRLMLVFIVPYTAVSTCAVRYPFVGICYFAYHPVLWPSFMRVVAPLFLILLAIMGVWFTIAYPPQALIFLLLNGPAGLLSSALMVFHQACVIYGIVARTFFLKKALRNLFDMVLKLNGLEDLLANASVDFAEQVDAQFYTRVQQSVVYKLRARYRKFVLRMTSPYLLLKSLILLPIQFIPVFGPLIMALVNSVDHARAAHGRYFQLKGFTPRQTRVFTRRKFGGYWTFGAAAGVLETVPLIDMFFSFTNTTGAALWAVTMEKKERKKAARH